MKSISTALVIVLFTACGGSPVDLIEVRDVPEASTSDATPLDAGGAKDAIADVASEETSTAPNDAGSPDIGSPDVTDGGLPPYECDIGGMIYVNGSTQESIEGPPGSMCLACIVSISQTSWSALPYGAACEPNGVPPNTTICDGNGSCIEKPPPDSGLSCGQQCTTNAECMAACPPVAGGGTNCCDTGSGACYPTSHTTCP